MSLSASKRSSYAPSAKCTDVRTNERRRCSLRASIASRSITGSPSATSTRCRRTWPRRPRRQRLRARTLRRGSRDHLDPKRRVDSWFRLSHQFFVGQEVKDRPFRTSHTPNGAVKDSERSATGGANRKVHPYNFGPERMFVKGRGSRPSRCVAPKPQGSSRFSPMRLCGRSCLS